MLLLLALLSVGPLEQSTLEADLAAQAVRAAKVAEYRDHWDARRKARADGTYVEPVLDDFRDASDFRSVPVRPEPSTRPLVRKASVASDQIEASENQLLTQTVDNLASSIDHLGDRLTTLEQRVARIDSEGTTWSTGATTGKAAPAAMTQAAPTYYYPTYYTMPAQSYAYAAPTYSGYSMSGYGSSRMMKAGYSSGYSMARPGLFGRLFGGGRRMMAGGSCAGGSCN